MSNIDLVIGNRQSEKSTYLFDKFDKNVKKNPNDNHFLFLPYHNIKPFKHKYTQYSNARIVNVNNYKNRGNGNVGDCLRGFNNICIYLDEFDYWPSSEVINTATPALKEVIAVTSPKFLRKEKDINPSHAFPTPGDPLITLLHMANFEFTFLFNEKAALSLLINRNIRREIILTEALGIFCEFD